jgi:hypothetical protein
MQNESQHTAPTRQVRSLGDIAGNVAAEALETQLGMRIGAYALRGDDYVATLIDPDGREMRLSITAS